MNTEFVEKVDGGWRGKLTGRLYVAPRECEQPAESGMRTPQQRGRQNRLDRAAT